MTRPPPSTHPATWLRRQPGSLLSPFLPLLLLLASRTQSGGSSAGDPPLPANLGAQWSAWVVETTSLMYPNGSTAIQSNYGMHYAYSQVQNYSCIFDGQDLLQPSPDRYRLLEWYPRKIGYTWGADGDCIAHNLTARLGRWEVPAAWRPLLAYEGTGIVQAAECNHWRAVGLPFNGPPTVANLSTANLTMSLDLWYTVAEGAPSLYIRMVDTPTAQIVLTDAVQGYRPDAGSEASSLCVPPTSCKGAPTPGQYGSYCVAKPNCNVGQLGGAVGWACGQLAPTGFDCATDVPANCSAALQDKANYIFSTYFEQFESSGATCDFGGVGTMSDPFKPLPNCVNE